MTTFLIAFAYWLGFLIGCVIIIAPFVWLIYKIFFDRGMPPWVNIK